jgi:lipoprotein-releasing system permease protein
VGAGRAGIAAVWLAYGAAIGLLGSVFGGVLAFLIVDNINAIHDWMGESLGLYVWDPSVYVFKRIPSEIDPTHATLVLLGGVLSCLIGALVPALRAAWMDPVRALRFE